MTSSLDVLVLTTSLLKPTRGRYAGRGDKVGRVPPAGNPDDDVVSIKVWRQQMTQITSQLAGTLRTGRARNALERLRRTVRYLSQMRQSSDVLSAVTSYTCWCKQSLRPHSFAGAKPCQKPRAANWGWPWQCTPCSCY